MKKIFLSLLTLLPLWAPAQQTKSLSLDDAVLGYYKGLYPERLASLQWARDADLFVYALHDTLFVKNPSGQTVRSFTASDFGRKRLPRIEFFTARDLIYRADTAYVFFHWKEKASDSLRFPAGAQNTDLNPAKKILAYTLDNNLYVADMQSARTAVTTDQDPNMVNGQAIARNEFGIEKGTFWSPDGQRLAFYRKDESAVDQYPLVDITVTPARLHQIKYPMNGRGSEEPGVGVYDPQTKGLVWLQLFDGAGKNHYVTNLGWGPKGKFIYLAEVNRDQNHMWLNKYDARSGSFVKTLFEETNPKWVEPEHPVRFVPGTDRFVWLSERDGFMNLYLYDTEGRLIRRITQNRFVTKDIAGFSPDGKWVYYIATGKDPRDNKLFRADLRHGRSKALTPASGWHRIWLSASGKYFIDRHSNVDLPGETCLASTAKPKRKIRLHTAANPLKDYEMPRVEMISIRGEFTDPLYGRIIRPARLEPGKKYPVLVYVYGGPHVQLVQNRWLGGARLWMLWLANQGYVVFTVDGHGSDNRGFAFESVIHRRLGQIEARDQMDGIAYLKTLPYVDGNRIAVHGWSFGGYMTLTLLTEYPETFTAGVAGGPVTDWKWYEVMYGERYMDTYKQNPEGFKQTSILNKIDRLQAKLLTIHGYQDDVVVPQHDIALHDRAIAKGIQMEFYLYPRSKHNVYGFRRVHLMKKVLNFIMQNNR